MRKLFLIGALSFLCVGCQSSKEKNQAVCTDVEENSQVKISQEIKLLAEDDELYKVVDILVYEFEDVERYQEDIDELVKEYKKKETCGELLDNGSCSKSVTFEWKLKDNKLTTKSTTDLNKAIEKKEKLSFFKTMPSDDYYISIDKTIESLKKQDFKCKKVKD